MGKQIREILGSLPDKILKRGEDYYTSGNIFSLDKSSDNVFSGRIGGSSGEIYRVTVQMAEPGEVLEYSCDCPYDLGDVCKHIAAVLLAIEKGDYKATKAGKSTTREKDLSKKDLPQLLEGLPREQLCGIILRHAEQDEKFKTGLILEIGVLDVESELAVIRQKIRHAIRENNSGGFIDEVGCDAVCAEMWECLVIAEERLGKGQNMISFEIALLVLMTAAALTSSADSSSGSLADVADEAIEQLDEACDRISKSAASRDKKYCYEKLCKEALDKVLKGWSEWSYAVLQIAALLVTEKNKAGIFTALDALKEQWKDEKHTGYQQTKDALTRLSIITVLEGEKAARKFIDSRLDKDEFRELAVNEDIKNGDFANAEKLCLEKTGRPEKPNYGLIPKWGYILYQIYERTGNRPKLIAAAKSLLLQGDMKYYQILKALYPDTLEWEQAYPLLLYELKASLPGNQYMRVLDWENEHELLFEEVKKYSGDLFKYGPKLAPHYLKGVYDLYSLEITKAAHEAVNRSQYGKMCGLIRELHNAGGKDEALSLTDGFIQEFKHRPAMLEELGKMKSKLK